jgi:hypothetical protein
MTNASQLWKTMTAAQRLAWGVLGAQIMRTDSLGQPYTLTGLQAWILVYLDYLTLALTLPPSLTAPALTVPNNPGVTTAVYDDSANTFVLTPIAMPDATSMFAVYATRPVSQGINFLPRSEFKLVQVFSNGIPTTMDIHAAYIALFGEAITGQKVFFYVQSFTTSGLPGPKIEGSTIVVA